MINFQYGVGHNFIDVTAEVLAKCLYGNRIYIPAGDTGASIFDDPAPGVLKGILVLREIDGLLQAQSYGHNERVWISLREDEAAAGRSVGHTKEIVVPPPTLTPDEVLAFFHSQLNFTGGELSWERIEQLNAVEFLRPDAKVLELGSGYGTNTMMISCILNDETNFVTLECNQASVEILRQNRAANDFRFHIEPAALSYRKLMYNPELMLTIPGEELRDGYEWINTMTFEEIVAKYAIDFDTLVADCEGALYYILQDNPRMLDNIRTVILESDYREAQQKWAVEELFGSYGFGKVRWWAMGQGGTDLPQECRDSFWEVWMR